MDKMSQIKQQGQKWAHLRKEQINCDQNSDTKIWMANVQGGDIPAREKYFPKLSFLGKLLFAIKTSQIRYTAS